MNTLPFAKARKAVALALTLTIISAVAAPAMAGSILREQPAPGSDMGSYDYCLKKSQVKYEFKKLGLRNISVKHYDDPYIYKVVGWAYEPKEEAAVENLGGQFDLLEKKKDNHDYDRVRYVFIFDACDRRIVEQLEPAKKLEMVE